MNEQRQERKEMVSVIKNKNIDENTKRGKKLPKRDKHKRKRKYYLPIRKKIFSCDMSAKFISHGK